MMLLWCPQLSQGTQLFGETKVEKFVSKNVLGML